MTKSDGLFLLEVLVDKVIFAKSPCFTDKDFRTCVQIECPSSEPLEICDDDPGFSFPKSDRPFIKSFNRGKSCLFSLPESEISKAMSYFPLKISVYKALPCGCLPTKIVMGQATIDMTKEFIQARTSFMQDPNGGAVFQALKDAFRIVGPDNSVAGEILLYLRISCFGKSIITNFQGAGAASTYETERNSAVDRSCTVKRNYQTPQDPCVCGAARTTTDGSGTHSMSCFMADVTPGQSQKKPLQVQQTPLQVQQPPLQGQQPPPQGQQYLIQGQQILQGLQIVQNPPSSGIVCPTVRDPYNSMPCQEDPDYPCYCSGPLPKGADPMACRNTDQYCLHVPKDCCPTGNKVIFQMPSDSCGMNHKQRAHFNFTSDGVGDLARDDFNQLISPNAEEYTGVKSDDLPKKVIKLKIGRTVEVTGRKSRLEYQFITPVIDQDPVIPIKDNSTAQCLPMCNCCQGCP